MRRVLWTFTLTVSNRVKPWLMISVVVLTTACSTGGTSDKHYRRGLQLAGQNLSAEAMREYLLAIEADDNMEAVMKSASELGHLSMNQHDLSEAHTYFEQAWLLATEHNHRSQMVLAQRDLGRCYRAEGLTAEAMRCFVRADSLLRTFGADSLRVYVYPEYVSLLMGEGRVEEARQLVSLLTEDRHSGPACLVAGKFYAEQGQTDSATYYLRRCLETDNVNSRASAAMYLSEMAADDANWEQAYGYAVECAALVDSAKLLMQAEKASLISSLGGQLEVERENYRLYRVIAAITVIAIVLIALLVIFVRERLARLKRQQEEERQASVSRARTQQELLIESFRNTALYRKVLMDETVSAEQWEEIELLLNTKADGFVDKLTAFYPAIKAQEMQVCQLLKLEFTNQQIAAIQCKTQQAITNLRKRLYQKMFEKEGTADELNQFLRLFPQEKGAVKHL